MALELTVLTTEVNGASSGGLSVGAGSYSDTWVKLGGAGFISGHRYLVLAHTYYRSTNNQAIPYQSVWYNNGVSMQIPGSSNQVELASANAGARWYSFMGVVTSTGVGSDWFLRLGNIGGGNVEYYGGALTAIDLDSGGINFQQGVDWGYGTHPGAAGSPINNTYSSHPGASVFLPSTGSYLILGAGAMSAPTGSTGLAEMQLSSTPYSSVLIRHQTNPLAHTLGYSSWRSLGLMTLIALSGSFNLSLYFGGSNIWSISDNTLFWIKTDSLKMSSYYSNTSIVSHDDIQRTVIDLPAGGFKPPISPPQSRSYIELFNFLWYSDTSTNQNVQINLRDNTSSIDLIATGFSSDNYLIHNEQTSVLESASFHTAYSAPNPTAGNKLVRLRDWAGVGGFGQVSVMQAVRLWLQPDWLTKTTSLNMYVAENYFRTASLRFYVAEPKTRTASIQFYVAESRTQTAGLQVSIAQNSSITTTLRVLVAQAYQAGLLMDVFRTGSEFRNLLMRVLVCTTQQRELLMDVAVAEASQIVAEMTVYISDRPFIVIEQDRPDSDILVSVMDLQASIHKNVVTSVLTDFEDLGVVSGDILEITTGLNLGNYVILEAVGHDLFVAEARISQDPGPSQAVIRKQREVIPQLKAAVVIDQPTFAAGCAVYSLMDISVVS